MAELEASREEGSSYSKISRIESQQIVSNLEPSENNDVPESVIAREKWEKRKEVLERARNQAI